jgi:AraC-like DNA-binding protein
MSSLTAPGRTERAEIVRQSSGDARWEIASRAPAAALRPFVRDFCGYSEWTAAGIFRRREFPAPQVVVIFEFGVPVGVSDNRDGHRMSRFAGGFVAGLDDRFTFTESGGFQSGLQLNLTPLGARLFFDMPMSEVAGRVVHFSDMVPREHRSIAERLASLPDWDARFDVIERLVTDRIGRARPLNAQAAWAYTQIVRSGGAIDIRSLTRTLGYSRTHLVTLFRDQIGFPPKLVARVIRFDRLMRHLRTGTPVTWAALAVEFGYYDQAHLVRDVKQFTGLTPTHTRAALIEIPGATTLEELRSAQQPAAPQSA